MKPLYYDHDFGFNFIQLFKKYGPDSHHVPFIKTPNTIQYWIWGLKPMLICHRNFGVIHNEFQESIREDVDVNSLFEQEEYDLSDFLIQSEEFEDGPRI